MKEILFLAPYPTLENEKDGMISRVKYIDRQFAEKKRAYLEVFLFGKGKGLVKDTNVDIYRLNILFNICLIFKIIFRAKLIYCHSLYSIRFLWPIVLMTRKCKVLLDIHGVVPEEERYFYKNYLRSCYFLIVEWFLFHKINVALCVTHAMEKEYRIRYKKAKCAYVIYGIMPVELQMSNYRIPEINDNDDVEIVYSGGAQNWQNIEMMMSAISQNIHKKVHYTVLTGDVERVKKIAGRFGLEEKGLLITSCKSYDLADYYVKAHYAFILRDNSLVNRVANPTKLIEYLFYGLIPIVWNPMIGDYNELGYECVNLRDFNVSNLKAAKSVVNRNIALGLMRQNSLLNLCDRLMGSNS